MKLKPQTWLLAIPIFIFLSACNITMAAAPTSNTPSISFFPSPMPSSSDSPTSAIPPPSNIQCSNGGCSADACIAKLNSAFQNGGQSPQIKTASPTNLNITPTVLAVYDINGGQISAPKFTSNISADLISYQKNTIAQKLIWDYFAAIIPADQRKEVANFIVSTDGKGGMLASVEQNINDPQKWALNVDIVDAGRPRNLTFTLIHEFGHLLTLNESQVTMDSKVISNSQDQQIRAQAASGCPQYFTTDGCSHPDSYINQFFNTFWPKLYPEWSKVNESRDQNGYFTLIASFYQHHPTQFISPYAATSPEEDIAESWAHFILTPKPADDSIAHQKVLFFYGFSELVQLRGQIAHGLCNYSQSQ